MILHFTGRTINIFFFYHIQQTQDSTLSGTILTKPFVKGRVVLKVKDHLLAAYGGFHMKQ